MKNELEKYMDSSKHYHKSNGDFSTATLAERFWNKVTKTDTCWIWSGSKGRNGYGRIMSSKESNAFLSSHRVAWELFNGKIPRGMLVCHHCDIPFCVNPSHLFLGTSKDNTQDMMKKGRGAWLKDPDNWKKISLPKSSKLKEKDVLLMRKLFSSGWTYRKLSKKFNVDYSHVHKTCNGKQWQRLIPKQNLREDDKDDSSPLVKS